jgi:hypothetical protein
VKQIRTRFAAGAAVLFVALFGGITEQLVSGHDPALASQTTTTPKSTPAAAPATTTSTSLSPVTTSQS